MSAGRHVSAGRHMSAGLHMSVIYGITNALNQNTGILVYKNAFPFKIVVYLPDALHRGGPMFLWFLLRPCCHSIMPAVQPTIMGFAHNSWGNNTVWMRLQLKKCFAKGKGTVVMGVCESKIWGRGGRFPSSKLSQGRVSSKLQMLGRHGCSILVNSFDDVFCNYSGVVFRFLKTIIKMFAFVVGIFVVWFVLLQVVFVLLSYEVDSMGVCA